MNALGKAHSGLVPLLLRLLRYAHQSVIVSVHPLQVTGPKISITVREIRVALFLRLPFLGPQAIDHVLDRVGFLLLREEEPVAVHFLEIFEVTILLTAAIAELFMGEWPVRSELAVF